MPFHPRVGTILPIDGLAFRMVAPRPGLSDEAAAAVLGIPGQQSTVFRLVADLQPGARHRALKVFRPRYRLPSTVGLCNSLASFAWLPGLAACDCVVLTPRQHGDLLRQHFDLTYSVLMPWVAGPTWAEIVREKRSLTREESLSVSTGLARLLDGLAKEQVAHCNLSGENVLLPGLQGGAAFDGLPAFGPVELVDLEQLYAPTLERPDFLADLAPEYSPVTFGVEKWGPLSDRFSGAVLLGEMLSWCDERVRAAACAGSYFSADAMQQPCERFHLMQNAISLAWGERLPQLLERAWYSRSSSQCPPMSEWLDALSAPDIVHVTDTLHTANETGARPTAEDAFLVHVAEPALATPDEVLAQVNGSPPFREQSYPPTSLIDTTTPPHMRPAATGSALGLPAPRGPGRLGSIIAMGLVLLALLVSGAAITFLSIRDAIGSSGLGEGQQTATAQHSLTLAASATALAFEGTTRTAEALTAATSAANATATAGADNMTTAVAVAEGTAVARIEATASTEAGETATVEAIDTLIASATVPDLVTPTRTATPATVVVPAELLGHTERLVSVAFSPGGTMLATGDEGGEIRIWDLSTFETVQVLNPNAGIVISLAFSSDGSLLAAACEDHQVHMFEAWSGQELTPLVGHDAPVRSVAFFPLAAKLVTGSEDKTVRVWSLLTWSTQAVLSDHTGMVNGVAVSSDEQTIASASADNTIKLWDWRSQSTRTLTGHKGGVAAVAFSDSDQTLASASWDKTSRLWRVADGAAIATLEGHTDQVYSIAFSPDGTHLATASRDETVRLWRPDGASIKMLHGHTGGVRNLAFSPVDRFLASVSQDMAIRLWSLP